MTDAELVAVLREAEMYHRRIGYFEEAVAFQQLADSCERPGSVQLDCCFIMHQIEEVKRLRFLRGLS